MASVIVLRGPVVRADLAGIELRLHRQLAEHREGDVILDLRDVEADAAAVDAVARLRLVAQDCGCRLAVRGCSAELRDLLAFMGLDHVVGGADS